RPGGHQCREALALRAAARQRRRGGGAGEDANALRAAELIGYEESRGMTRAAGTARRRQLVTAAGLGTVLTVVMGAVLVMGFRLASNMRAGLVALQAALSATLQRSSSDAAAQLRTLLLAGVLAALSLAGAAGYFQLTRSKHERAALEAQEQTRDILKTVREGLFLLDSDHRIGTVWSDALTRMFSRQDFAGLSFERLLKDLVPPATLTTATKYIKLLWG